MSGEEERKGPRRWRQEGKYLFSGLSVHLQTSACPLRKLSPAWEQSKQTIPIAPSGSPWNLVCLFAQTAAMTDGGTLEREKTEEERQKYERRSGRRRSGFMEVSLTDGVLFLFPKALLSPDMDPTGFINNSSICYNLPLVFIDSLNHTEQDKN